MYDELTEVDIKKMEEEIAYRRDVLAPRLLAEMSRTRAFGDLSENAEYKEAKREKRRNEGRIRYLLNMIRTARVIEVEDTDRGDGRVALFDWVVIYNEAMGKEKRIQIVTTLRQDATKGFVSKESPLGSALMGRAVGDRVKVEVNETKSYYAVIRSIEKGEDNEDLPISAY
ncbi:MAG: GreA/GreB family elongation factor [Clostridia bacterium]|nr:GreA/GreB family elongation factor [Clostridia bacterium]